MLTGLDIEAKAKVFEDALFKSVGGKEQFDEVSIQLHRTDKENPISNEESMASLVISVKSMNADLVGRLFSAKLIELALANIPGFFAQGGVKSSGPVIVYWPALVDSKHIKEKVYIEDKEIEIIPTSQMNFEDIYYQRDPIEIEEIEAVACAVQNMQLTCTAYGLGSFWSTPKLIYSKEMNTFLNLTEKDKCLGLIYIGYPAIKWPKSHRKPINYNTTWITQ